MARRDGRRRLGRLHKDQCESCGVPCSFPSFFDVDHKQPIARGGSNDPENLQLLCPNCHRFKTLTERGLLPPDTKPSAWRLNTGDWLREFSSSVRPVTPGSAWCEECHREHDPPACPPLWARDAT